MFDAFSHDAQLALDRFRSHWAELDAMPGRAEGRIALVGRKGSGKKSLCNSLWGWPALGDDLPDEMIRALGLFTLITVPDDSYEESAVLYRLESADLIIYLVDGPAGIQADDVRWIARLRALPAALLIVINKTNLMLEAPAASTLAQMQDQFARPVIALNVQDQNAVHEQFLPQMLKTCPALTVPLAAEITSLRWQVVGRLIRESAIMSGLVTLENGATVDVHALLDLQRRLLRQMARVYGYADPDEDGSTNISTVVQRVLFDSAAQVIARFGPLGRGIAVGLIGASGTWALGRSAQVRYTGEALFPRVNGLFSRNGDHGSTPDRP